jgi:hypothetical protein
MVHRRKAMNSGRGCRDGIFKVCAAAGITSVTYYNRLHVTFSMSGSGGSLRGSAFRPCAPATVAVLSAVATTAKTKVLGIIVLPPGTCVSFVFILFGASGCCMPSG